MTGPAIHGRLDDLLAASHDPAPRKTRRIEWVGEQSPYDNPVIAWNLLMGRYTPTQQRAIRLAAAQARTRECRERLMEHNHQHAQAVMRGLSRTYHWHKGNEFICDVDYADVDRILGSDAGHEFRDLDAMEGDQPTILLPPESVMVYATESIGSAQAIAGALIASH